MPKITLLLLCSILLSFSVTGADKNKNSWQGNVDSNWENPQNWSSKRAPADSDTEIVIAPNKRKIYPVIKAPLTINRSCLIAKDAQLTFVEQPGTLVLDHGSFCNDGIINGSFSIQVRPSKQKQSTIERGATGSQSVQDLTLSPSVFPYVVRVKGNLHLKGDLLLGGGHLFVEKNAKLSVDGNIVFQGKTPSVQITLGGDIVVKGTVINEGSANCFDASGTGWVCLTGTGNQTIKTAGNSVLPPIRLLKPSGTVSVNGDLHCSGLWVSEKNDLELAKGQTLIFGTPVHNWQRDPKSVCVIHEARKLIPARTSRDLINQGTLSASGSVPVSFYFRSGKQAYCLKAHYQQGTTAATAVAATGNDLTLDKPGSRLKVVDGKVLLDGKPFKGADAAALDAVLDDLDDSAGKSGSDGKAVLKSLVLEKLAPKIVQKDLLNIAPFASAIHTVPSISTYPNGCSALTDGSIKEDVSFRRGVTRPGFYQFTFPKKATVSAIRFMTGGLFNPYYVLSADTTGDGVLDRDLVFRANGVPGEWVTTTFPKTTLYSLRFEALPGGQAGWEQSYPSMREFEIYADKPSYQALKTCENVNTAPVTGPEMTFSTMPKQPVFPQELPKNYVSKNVLIAPWMFGLVNDDTARKAGQPLKEHLQLKKMLKDIKDLKFDGVVVFNESSESIIWPSTNFYSMGNTAYQKDWVNRKKEQELLSPETDKPKKKAGDELDGMLDDKENGKSSEVLDAALNEDGAKKVKASLEISDLPFKRNLMKEFCDACHDAGLKVYFICRPEDVGKMFIGTKSPGMDLYGLLLEEAVHNGADGVSLTCDEAYYGRSYPTGKGLADDDPVRQDFKTRWGKDAKLPGSIWGSDVNYKRWTVSSYEKLADMLKTRQEKVRRINPTCITYTCMGSHPFSVNNRMTYGLAYDVAGQGCTPDFIGTDYMGQMMRRFIGANRNRQASMTLYVPKSVREGIQCVMQGARWLGYYRYNYIRDVAKSADYRLRENTFINNYCKAGATRPAKADIALLVSRASEDWWDNNHGTCWLGSDPEAKRGFWSFHAFNNLLIRNGYTFDVYYLDQPASLKDLDQYKLAILPFPYSIPAQSATILKQAFAKGTRFLVNEKQGEVDEVGRARPTPVLAEIVTQGVKKGTTHFLREGLLSIENRRGIDATFSAIIDKLLGSRRLLQIQNNGERYEATISRPADGQYYLTIINWEDSASKLGISLNLPPGQYLVMSLSSEQPTEFKSGAISQKSVLSNKELKNFVLKMLPGQALLLTLRKQ